MPETAATLTQLTTSAIRIAPIVALSLGYLAYVFQLHDAQFWTAGIGEWLDPYFINFLLEHWHASVLGLTDPTSPPMFFPVQGTLGYSHGLILYVPFYMAARAFLHPFQAYNVMFLVVVETGIICLYFVFRRWLRLGTIESLLLTTFFFTSQNIINIGTGTWSQRASVFLIPPMILILLASRRMTATARRTALALGALSGLLFTLLLTHEFYTGLFAAVFGVLALVAYYGIGQWSHHGRHLATLWAGDARILARAPLVIALVIGAWTIYVWIFGGVSFEAGDLRISSNDWRRPAMLALVSVAIYAHVRGGWRRAAGVLRERPWLVSVSLGACAGCLAFLYVYLGPYSDHHVFPRDQLMNAFIPRDVAHWRGALDALVELGAYDTRRPFVFAAIVGVLAWLPWFAIDRHSRVSWLWLMAISAFVVAISVNYSGFTLWTFLLLDRLPGLSAIRDPKRIVYVYELALVLATGVFLSRLPPRSVFRTGVSVLLVCLFVTSPNWQRFELLRSNDAYDRWVSAPIAIDRSCRSFFIQPASAEYMSRSTHMWSLYNVDAMFVAVKHGLPTLNGYSAWSPKEWSLANPQESGYAEAVDEWIARHHLEGVCGFDIDRRTIAPYARSPAVPLARGAPGR